MTREERQKLREAATAAARATAHTTAHTPPRPVLDTWNLQTSNSFRRIGTHRGDGNVLCAVTQRSDGHPDLHAPHGVLAYVVAAQPAVVIALLDQLDAAEAELERIAVVELAKIAAIVKEQP